MKRFGLIAVVILLTFFAVPFVFAESFVSVNNCDFSVVQKMQRDVDELKFGVGDGNQKLNVLWESANRIARLNDRCATISINDVLDDECSRFYEFELPDFEKKYMEVTGELRLNAIDASHALTARSTQIYACAVALEKNIYSKEQLFKLEKEGSLNLEPLNTKGDFEVDYNFKLYLDESRKTLMLSGMERWMEKCGEIVKQSGKENFSPLFIEYLASINDSLKDGTTNIELVVEKDSMNFYLDLRSPQIGSYFLNDKKMFEIPALPMGRENSHLVVDVLHKRVYSPMDTIFLTRNFKGKMNFSMTDQKNGLVGRLIWGDIAFKKNNSSNVRNDVLIKDNRDGKSYRTIKVGSQIWMAQNLDYRIGNSRCYNNDSINCLTYGRLYDWHTAMSACPGGWHLPSKNEYDQLLENSQNFNKSGMILKSRKDWDDDGNGTDDLGFSIRPAGFLSSLSGFSGKGGLAGLWTSTKIKGNRAHYLFFYHGNENAIFDYDSYDAGYSVRCVKD